eukprot:scaffold117601_cov57-Phaeocystis_antarctica.AAC.3
MSIYYLCLSIYLPPITPHYFHVAPPARTSSRRIATCASAREGVGWEGFGSDRASDAEATNPVRPASGGEANGWEKVLDGAIHSSNSVYCVCVRVAASGGLSPVWGAVSRRESQSSARDLVHCVEP